MQIGKQAAFETVMEKSFVGSSPTPNTDNFYCPVV